MYESPITAIVNEICSDIQKKEDEHIMECVHNVGIDVNKKELVKALSYDRHQYDKGYNDGYNDGTKVLDKIIEEIEENNPDDYFSTKPIIITKKTVIGIIEKYKKESD